MCFTYYFTVLSQKRLYNTLFYNAIKIMIILSYLGGARDVMVIVAGNGHGDESSNPGRDRLQFT